MMKCLNDFFNKLFSKEENSESVIEEPIEFEEKEEVILKTPKVIESQ